jgi:hypothetical protein
VAAEQTAPPYVDRREDDADLFIRGRGQRSKAEGAVLAVDKHAVQDQRVEVDVQIAPAAESLDHRHAAGVAVAKAAAPGASSLERQQDACVHRKHGATEIVIPCQKVAEPVGQAQHPLHF